MSDVVWQTLIQSAFGLAGLIYLGWMNRRQGKQGEQLHEIKTLVNSNWAIQLRREARLARRVAEMPGASREDMEAAEQAERLLANHEAQQAELDAQRK